MFHLGRRTIYICITYEQDWLKNENGDKRRLFLEKLIKDQVNNIEDVLGVYLSYEVQYIITGLLW